jgi:aminobenzoyl-glutamate utilization protein B
VLANNAKQAAGVTGCNASVRWVTKTRVGLANNALAELTWQNLQLVGPPAMPDEAREFACEIQRNLGLEAMDNPFADSNERLLDPREHEAAIRRNLPDWQLNSTSDDYVEYCWHAPTVRLLTARPALRSPDPSFAYPAWTRNALGGVAAAVDPGMFVAGKTIAATIIDLLTRSDELQRCKDEFNERTGGGVGGSKWVAPLLSRDFAPPVDLRWPEYIHTVRGEEWWIPTTKEAAYEQL